MRSEADTRANFIDPALATAGWGADTIIREHYFTDGRKLAGGQRGSRCFVDYLLLSESRNLAVIEAKKEGAHPAKGLQQALDYAAKLSVRFVYSTNGEQIYEFDRDAGSGSYIAAYPSPEELLARYAVKSTDLSRELRNIPFQVEGNFSPRYYQELAVHAATDALGHCEDRILLTLATGTGKTFIAFQIAHKLFQARWNRANPGERRPRILFLADRERDEEDMGGYYREYPPDFFDMVIIDECHRGAANEYGSWRTVLNHFESAIHLGMTATPKRTDNIDTYDYFGDPVYEYSLKEGISDGFLTPYRVKRIRTNLDELVLTDADEIIKGEAEQMVYETPDYDRKIVVDQRTALVAKAILDNTEPLEKTIIFCADQNHALTMRDMINTHKTVNAFKQLKEDCDLSAKNPAKQADIDYMPPADILKLIQTEDEQVQTLLSEIGELLEAKNG